mgnify:CR=1 FL=1
MKRLLLLLACLLALCTTVVAAEPAISDMKTDCTLTGSGACQVTQTFTMEIDGAQTQLRFPLVPGAKKASVAGYDAQKQTDGDCPVLVLSDASGFTGTRSFTVLYSLRPRQRGRRRADAAVAAAEREMGLPHQPVSVHRDHAEAV